ncbi:MAG: hypothetical protein ACHQ50_11355 [Fimbriimonadales bacterium]
MAKSKDPRYSGFARLWILPARDAPRVVVIRRKPAAWWHVLLWETGANTITHGAWHKGVFYPTRSDVSPNGELMTCMLGWGWGRGVATVPDLTWLLRWCDIGSYGSAGLFVSEAEIEVDLGCTFRQIFDTPGFTVRQLENDFLSARLLRDGWTQVGDRNWFLKPSGSAPMIEMREMPFEASYGHRFCFEVEGAPQTFNDSIFWACYDCLGQLLVAREGRIEQYKSGDFLSHRPSYVCDLNDLVRPPDHQFTLFPLSEEDMLEPLL